MTYEVNQALARIRDPNAAKKVATVLRLATAAAAGESMATVFAKPDTCSEKVWHGWTDHKTGKKHRGWKQETAIKTALDMATARARWWVTIRAGKAVQDALDELTAAAPDVAKQMVRIATQGRAAVVNGDQPGYIEADVKDVIKAADSILNRVSDKTADKAPANTVIRLTWGESGEEEQGA